MFSYFFIVHVYGEGKKANGHKIQNTVVNLYTFAQVDVGISRDV